MFEFAKKKKAADPKTNPAKIVESKVFTDMSGKLLIEYWV